jgi:hypothetical protein
MELTFHGGYHAYSPRRDSKAADTCVMQVTLGWNDGCRDRCSQYVYMYGG